MQIILLSGGSGKRLWPLSNDIRSKQFLKVFKTEDGLYESMVQRVYRQITKMCPDANVTVATAKTQVSAIRNQLGDNVGISVEPCRRDTFPAIVLATAYLQDIKGVGPEEPIIVCPVDPFVDDIYFEALKELSGYAQQGAANISLMGIEPLHPSEKYGYIIPESSEHLSKVKAFKEKPVEAVAKKYIAEGALWNGGVFAYKLGYMMNRAHEMIDFTDYTDLFNNYSNLNKISFDYAVLEHESNIAVMRFSGKWKDLGTWNTLTEEMVEPTMGNVILEGTCKGVNVVNELSLPILCVGLKDVIVAASPDGILVSDKDASSHIKQYVDGISNQVMFAEKSWGSYQVLDVQNDSITVKISLRKGQKLNYHSHDHRNEIWTILSGEGHIIVDGLEQRVKAGDVVTMQAGCKHTVIADTELQIVEVQIGSEINVSDKHKYDLEFK